MAGPVSSAAMHLIIDLLEDENWDFRARTVPTAITVTSGENIHDATRPLLFAQFAPNEKESRMYFISWFDYYFVVLVLLACDRGISIIFQDCTPCFKPE